MKVKWTVFDEEAYQDTSVVYPLDIRRQDFIRSFEGEVVDKCFSNFWGNYFIVKVEDRFMKVNINEATIIEE